MKSRWIIDTNLLTLLVLGSVSRDLIGQHKRIRAFVPEDFDELSAIIGTLENVCVTPNTLTELSNLVMSDGLEGQQIAERVRFLTAHSIEQYIESAEVVKRTEFARLGLADAAQIQFCVQESIGLLTTDAPLAAAVHAAGGRAINFNHRRSYLWD